VSGEFDRTLDRLFLCASHGELRRLRGYLSELLAPQDELRDVSPPTPAETDAALDWLLDRIGYERAA